MSSTINLPNPLGAILRQMVQMMLVEANGPVSMGSDIENLAAQCRLRGEELLMNYLRQEVKQRDYRLTVQPARPSLFGVVSNADFELYLALCEQGYAPSVVAERLRTARLYRIVAFTNPHHPMVLEKH